MNKLYNLAFLLTILIFALSNSVIASPSANSISGTFNSSNNVTKNISISSKQTRHNKQHETIEMDNVIIVCSGGICYPVVVPH